MPKKKQSYDFENSISELEQLVEQMESGELSLEDSLASFEKGIKLTRECQAMLVKAEQKVQLLTQKNDGCELESYEEKDE